MKKGEGTFQYNLRKGRLDPDHLNATGHKELARQLVEQTEASQKKYDRVMDKNDKKKITKKKQTEAPEHAVNRERVLYDDQKRSAL